MFAFWAVVGVYLTLLFTDTNNEEETFFSLIVTGKLTCQQGLTYLKKFKLFFWRNEKQEIKEEATHIQENTIIHTKKEDKQDLSLNNKNKQHDEQLKDLEELLWESWI